MLKPRFRYTRELAAAMETAAGAAAVLRHLPLPAESQARLVDEAARRAGYAPNYADALAYIAARLQTHQPVSEDALQQLHRLTMAGLPRGNVLGVYRKGQNPVTEPETARLVYMPPTGEDVPRLMTELLEWLEGAGGGGGAGAEARSHSGLVQAAMATYQVATIRPWMDGNGHLARLLATWVLRRNGYDAARFITLEQLRLADRVAYDRRLDPFTDTHNRNYYGGRAEADVTGWVEFFVRGVAELLRDARVRVEGEVKGGLPAIPAAPALPAAGNRLPPLQAGVLALARDRPSVAVRELVSLLGEPRRSVQLALSRLVGRRVLRREGHGRSVRYVVRP